MGCFSGLNFLYLRISKMQRFVIVKEESRCFYCKSMKGAGLTNLSKCEFKGIICYRYREDYQKKMTLSI